MNRSLDSAQENQSSVISLKYSFIAFFCVLTSDFISNNHLSLSSGRVLKLIPPKSAHMHANVCIHLHETRLQQVPQHVPEAS